MSRGIISSALIPVILLMPIILSMHWPPITSNGAFIKPPIGPDPVSMYMNWVKDSTYPYEDNTGYAAYQYAYCYELPVRLVMEVDVDPEIESKPTIFYRHDVPYAVDFGDSITSDIDILDNIGYDEGWRFIYTWWTFCSEGYKEIGFTAFAGIDDQGKNMYAGVGDPQGPSFLEPADYDSYYVEVIGGHLSLPPSR